MKALIFSILVAVTLLTGCVYNCENNRRPNCIDRIPPNGPCDYSYTRWFYNPAANTCERYNYYGCNSYGFGSKDECEKCQCH